MKLTNRCFHKMCSRCHHSQQPGNSCEHDRYRSFSRKVMGARACHLAKKQPCWMLCQKVMKMKSTTTRATRMANSSVVQYWYALMRGRWCCVNVMGDWQWPWRRDAQACCCSLNHLDARQDTGRSDDWDWEKSSRLREWLHQLMLSLSTMSACAMLGIWCWIVCPFIENRNKEALMVHGCEPWKRSRKMIDSQFQVLCDEEWSEQQCKNEVMGNGEIIKIQFSFLHMIQTCYDKPRLTV